eukprot:m.2555 g.2555  ORF g.2555 m.2555 type:complete len:553 (-) comp1833_c0_seq2:379-2037(-)
MELAVVSDRHLFLYDSVPESTPRTIELHDSGIQSVSWNHKNQILATCGLDGKIAFCTAQDLVEQDIMGVHAKQSAPMYSLCFSHDSHHLAFGGENGMVNLFNLRRKESNIVSGYDSPITSLSYNNNSGLMAFGDVKGNLALYNTVDRSTSRLEDETNQSITNIAFSKLSGSTCAASLYNGLVKVYDTARINAVTTFSIHEKAATGTEFYPNNKTLFVSCGMDKKVAFYSLQQNKHVQTIDVSAPITSMSIRSDGKLLALGRNDGDVTLIDFRNLKSPYGVLRTGTAQSIMSLKYKNKERSRRSHATPTEKGISSSSRTASEQTPMDTTVPTTYKTDKASVNISKVSSNPSDLERDSTFARSSLTSSKESARPSQRDGSSVRTQVVIHEERLVTTAPVLMQVAKGRLFKQVHTCRALFQLQTNILLQRLIRPLIAFQLNHHINSIHHNHHHTSRQHYHRPYPRIISNRNLPHPCRIHQNPNNSAQKNIHHHHHHFHYRKENQVKQWHPLLPCRHPPLESWTLRDVPTQRTCSSQHIYQSLPMNILFLQRIQVK